MAQLDIRQWAVKGAEQRLLEISEEAKAIFAAFPELRGRRRGFGAATTGAVQAGTTRGVQPAKRRRRSKMSAEGRRRISEAQKARWATQKAALSQASGPGGREGVAKSAAKRGPRKKK